MELPRTVTTVINLDVLALEVTSSAYMEPPVWSASFCQGELISLMGLFGVIVGLVAAIYDYVMQTALTVVWTKIPKALERALDSSETGLDALSRWGFLYTIAASSTLATGAGVAIKLFGFPGGLSNVIHCVHTMGYVPIKQALPMVLVSLLSIVAGGSVGPEAPLVAISACICGWLSTRYFKHDVVMTRKCTIMGMSAALSAFFGVQLGGALFALEVLHTMGMQFFEIAVYAVGAGGVSATVYSGIRRMTLGAIWSFPAAPLSNGTEIVLGSLLGAAAGVLGILFQKFFRLVGKGISGIGLGHYESTHSPILLAALGGLSISVIGVLVPPTMFWSEDEMRVIAEPGTELPYVWPPGGLFFGVERYPWESCLMYFLVGFAKLLAIACSVQTGLQGGFIFPLFFAGASIGRGLFLITDSVLPEGVVSASPALMTMCLAAGLNVAVTRTPFSSPLIVAALSGVPNVMAPAVCASLASLFVIRSTKFIGTQRDRADLKFAGDLKSLDGAETSTSTPPNGDTPREAGSSAPLRPCASPKIEYSAVEESMVAA